MIFSRILDIVFVYKKKFVVGPQIRGKVTSLFLDFSRITANFTKQYDFWLLINPIDGGISRTKISASAACNSKYPPTISLSTGRSYENESRIITGLRRNDSN